ncbi:MAG: hypothetical protein NTX40_00190 [Planctomycetota bacterium]|nr:hypothetical protein [Planctomycetota bacterium]
MNRHTNTFWAAVLSAFVVFGLAASRGLAEEADSPGVLAVSVLRTLREDPASIVGMSEAELILTCRALVGAGGREAAGLICATWVEGSDKYKSSSTDTLCQLATFSRMAAEAGQAAVQRVAGHVQEVYLAQPDATRSVKPGQWQALTGVLAAGLSEGSRASWAASLRAAFVEDGGVLAGLKLADVQTLSGALAALGDQQPHRPVTAWVETTTAWQALKPGDLVSLSRSLAAAKETGQAALQQVASHVEQTYTADAAAMKSVSLGDWRNLTGVLAGKMSEESRERLSGHLLAAYVDNGEALQGLKVGDVQALSGALAALGDQQPHRPVTAWVETTTAWQTLNPAELVSLAGSLASAKEQGQSARQHLASHVESTCLANPDVVRSVPLNCWRDLAVRLAQDLPDENRGRWMSTLRATFTEAAGAFETLMLGDVQALTAALKSLGDAQADSVPPAWVERTKGWKALDQKGLISLASSLAASKEAGQVARQRVAAHVQEQFLPSIEATRSVSSSEWGEFAGRLGADLSEENRTVWANGLRAAYVQNAETFAGLKLADVQGLSRALSSLGEENAVAVVALWVDQTAGWRDLKPPDLVSLAGTLAAVKEEGASARQRLASHLETAYLADAAATRSVSAAQWRDLASRLVPDLSEEKRSAWAAGLRAAYVQDAEVLAAQKLDDVLGLGDALKALGDKQAQEPLATWVQATTAWRSLKPNELASKLASRLTTDTEAGRAARECLVAHVESTYLADAEAVRAVGGGQWKELMGHVAKWLSDERRAAWAAQLRAACVEDAGVLTAMELGDVQGLSAALKSLGDKEADAVAAVWAESTSAWQEYAPNALASLANSLLAAGDAGRSVRQRLAAHVQQRYLSTPEAAREIGSAAWRELVAPLRQDLTSESRIEWAQRIRDAYGGSEAVLVGLNLGELEALCKPPASLSPNTSQTRSWATPRRCAKRGRCCGRCSPPGWARTSPPRSGSGGWLHSRRRLPRRTRSSQ